MDHLGLSVPCDNHSLCFTNGRTETQRGCLWPCSMRSTLVLCSSPAVLHMGDPTILREREKHIPLEYKADAAQDWTWMYRRSQHYPGIHGRFCWEAVGISWEGTFCLNPFCSLAFLPQGPA